MDPRNCGYCKNCAVGNYDACTDLQPSASAEPVQEVPVSVLDEDAYVAERVRAEQDQQRGAIAYQLTKRLVIDMPTARAAVDAALNASPPPVTAAREQEASATGAEKVYLVCTGEVYEGRETYTRHDRAPQMCDFETLYATPTTSTTGKVDASRVRDEALREAADRCAAQSKRWKDERAIYVATECAAAIRSLIGTHKSAEGGKHG